MKILLVGEYSNLHNTLQEGLQALGHEVTLIGSGDAFKNFPADVDVRGKTFQDKPALNFIRQGIYRIFKTDISLLETAFRTQKQLSKMKPFDVIQLINEYPLKTPYLFEKRIIQKLRKLTKRLVVLGCGDDWVYMNNIHKLPHHPSRRFDGKIKFPFSEMYLSQKHKTFHQFVFNTKDLIITTDMDYHTVYKGNAEYYGMIPNPVNLQKIAPVPVPKLDKIRIFHGINRVNYYKKGNDIFEEALEIINTRFGDKIEIYSTENLPYSEYITRYEKCHILLDQTYALDQGYNALEAMAKGKVVFTGAGKDFCKKYNLEQDTVAIHTIPDVNEIVNNLAELIENPTRITEIGQNAQQFISKHHNYKEVAQQYVDAWNTIN
tara:strand:- start:312 stop:1442 length:1131 start_codon:yes stop_codon:yes gene_type:complete